MLYYPNVRPNDHLDALQQHFGRLNAGILDIPDNVNFLLLGFTNRSGSNYLAELIASDGRIANAGENLNFDTVLEHSVKHGFKSLHEYFQFLVRHTCFNNIVSIKVAPAHLEVLAVAGILEKVIDRCKFVVIERNDKLGQAISHAIAFQTGKFMSTMADTGATPALNFNADELTMIIEDISESYKQFSLFFSRNGIVPAHVMYEHLVADQDAVIKYIGQHIGIADLSAHQDKVTLQKQANARNKEWRELYLRTGYSHS
jgi:trehalose 2-sulfotransferase